jgi:hypothetical protein
MKNIKYINISSLKATASIQKSHNYVNPNSCSKLWVKPTVASSTALRQGGDSEQIINCVSNQQKIGLQLMNNLEKNNWPGLVYLQKRGSSHSNPNPNIISYKFPGAKHKSNGFNSTSSQSALYQLKANYLNKVGNKSITNLNRFIINNVYKLLFIFCKSMYCLISKPVFITGQDKIKIQLFYFVCTNLASANRKFINAYYDHKINAGDTNKDLAILPLLVAVDVGLTHKGNYHKGNCNYNCNYKGNNLTKVYPNKFKIICEILSKFFNKTVELELIRIHKPYFDSTILVNYLALIINKKNIANSIKKLYDSNIIQSPAANCSSKNLWPGASTAPTSSGGKVYNMENLLTAKGFYTENKRAIELIGFTNNWLGLSHKAEFQPVPATAYLAGLNIKISGRLMREAIVPRITTKKFEKGFTANGKVNYSDVARFTHKNRKGAFTITIKSGQKF